MYFNDRIPNIEDKVHRCSICDKVNIQEIENNLGDYDSDISFVSDPSDASHFICIDCSTEIQEIRDEYAFWDSLKNGDEDEWTLIVKEDL